MQQKNRLGRHEYKISKLVVSSRKMQAKTTVATATAVSHNQPAPDGVRSSAPEDRFESLYKSFLDSVSLTILSIHAQVRNLQYRCQFLFCCRHLLVLPLSVRGLTKSSSSTFAASSGAKKAVFLQGYCRLR